METSLYNYIHLYSPFLVVKKQTHRHIRTNKENTHKNKQLKVDIALGDLTN